MNAKTIPNLFEQSAQKYSKNPLIYEKKSGKYSPSSFEEIRQEVHNFANGLLKLGLKKDDKVVLLSEGRREWLVSELALLYIGAVVVPISIKLNEASDLQFRLEHSESRFAIASVRQAEKLRLVIPQLKKFESLVLLDEPETRVDNELLYSEIVESGKLENSEKLESLLSTIQQNDIAVISYTSGTTADPKGIMLSHRNFTANVEQAHSLSKSLNGIQLC